MKAVCVTSAILFVCTAVAPVSADTCIKQKRHTDEYYYGGVITPEDNTESELWFGGKKMAAMLPNRIIISDAENNVLIFANKRDSSYVETTLPFDWANVLDEGTLAYLARYRTEGTIEETESKFSVTGARCTSWRRGSRTAGSVSTSERSGSG